MAEVTVVGAGGWGQALALHALRAGHAVRLQARDPDRLRTPDGHSRRLPGIALPDGLAAGGFGPAADADIVLLAVPVQHMRAIAAGLSGRAPIIGCCKGLEAATLRLPGEILAELHPGRAALCLTGPNFALEIARGLPACAVLAGRDGGLADRLAAELGTERFRVYAGTDPIAAELGGAAKNVVAIAAGVAIGAGFGENARAALITRGLAEIARLAVALGGRAETVSGLSGAGDLILTCTGAASRNFGLGLALGGGRRAADALAGRDDVAEGAATAPALRDRAARAGVELPIASVVADLLAGSLDAGEAARLLLERRPGRE